MKNAETLPPSGKPHRNYFLLYVQLVYAGLFIFPILPLKSTNILLILFITGVLGIMKIFRQHGVFHSLKANIFFIIPFVPYLIEFLFFPHNGVARFALEKKLLLLIGPAMFPFFLIISKESRQKLPLILFTLTLVMISVYTLTSLFIAGTIQDMNSYTNEAYILRTRFEAVSHLHPTYYSLFCVTAIMILLTSMSGQTGKVKGFFIFFAVLLAFGVLVVGSKSGLIILSVCLVIFIIRLQYKKFWKIMLLTILILSGIVSVISFPSLKARLEGLFTPLRTGLFANTLNQRSMIFSCSVKTFYDHMFLGTGSRNSQILLDACYEKRPGARLAADTFNAHNQYLTIGINYGIFVLMIFLFSLSKAAWTIIHHPAGLYFLISIMVVFLTESVLECQMGVYFYTLFMTYFYTVQKSQEVTPKLETFENKLRLV